ncbi:MAG: polyhydroxybutyrate depolymerase [Myxococcota bacterium]|jgi:polyhydroxybutyrate depolymerase
MSTPADRSQLSRRHLISGAGALSGLVLAGGCGNGAEGFAGNGKDGSRRVEIQVRDRPVGVFLPRPRATKGMPLIVFLHPGNHNMLSISKIIGLFSFDSEFPAVVAVPNGQSWFFNRDTCHWNSGHTGSKDGNDITHVDAVLTNVIKKYNLDSTRVFLMGTSNGGMMAYRAMTELSSKVKAFAVHAATVGGRASADAPLILNDPNKHGAQPTSLLHTHGELDGNVRKEGGPTKKDGGTRIDISMRESVGYWIKLNGIKKPSDQSFQVGTVWKAGGGKNGTRVWVKIVTGGGHGWEPSNMDLALEFFGLR